MARIRKKNTMNYIKTGFQHYRTYVFEIANRIPSVYHSKIEILEYKGDNLNTFLSSFLNTE